MFIEFVLLQLRYALGGKVDPLTQQYLTIFGLSVRSISFQSFFNQRVSQEPMSIALRFIRRLITLRRGQNLHAFLISELRQALGVHRTATFLFSFERLSRVTSINHQQHLTGLDPFDRVLNFFIRDTV